MCKQEKLKKANSDEKRERRLFIEAVQRGFEDADAGRFVSETELDANIEDAIRRGRFENALGQTNAKYKRALKRLAD